MEKNMKTSIVTHEELQEMKEEVLKQMDFAKKVGARTKDLERQYAILMLAQVGLAVK